MALLDGDTTKGTAYVSFERDHRIERYPFGAQKFGPPTGALPLPPGTKQMRPNSGLEAIALLRAGPLKGTLVAFSESLTDSKGDLQGWLIGGPTPGPFTLKRLEGFDVTDAAPTPDGGLFVLERRFRYSEGIKMRIRRIRRVRSSAVPLSRARRCWKRPCLEHRQYGGHCRPPVIRRRDNPHFDLRR